MSNLRPAVVPAPVAGGVLSEKPLAHLLVYALDRQLTGTFELDDDPDQYALIVVAGGMIPRVWTSEPVDYLGHVLYESGALDAAKLATSLAEIATTKELHGQALLAKHIINLDQLAGALRQQRLRKLHHVFSFRPAARFKYYTEVDLIGERPHDVEPVDPLPSIWRGIAAHPMAEQAHAAVAALGTRAIRLSGALDVTPFRAEERVLLESLRHWPATLAEIALSPGVDARVAEMIVDFLLITKQAEVAEAGAAPIGRVELPGGRVSFAPTRPIWAEEPISQRPSAPPSPRLSAPPSSRVSAPPSGGQLSGPPSSSVRPATSVVPEPVSSRPSVLPTEAETEVEQLLAKAEMHFVVGDRPQALSLVREVLNIAPKNPAGTVLLAALEASTVKDGQEAKLRDIIKRIDSILLYNRTCRRGHYYRGRLRKRIGDFDGAMDDFRQAIENDPDDGDSKSELRACQRKEKERESVSVTRGVASFLDRFRGK